MKADEIIDETYIKCVNGVLHKMSGVGVCSICVALNQQAKEIFDDIEKNITPLEVEMSGNKKLVLTEVLKLVLKKRRRKWCKK